MGRASQWRGRRLLALSVVGGVLLALAAGPPAVAQGPDERSAERLKKDARGSVALRVNRATDRLAFARAGRNGDLLPEHRSRRAVDKAQEFVEQYGALFGSRDDGRDLVRLSTVTDQFGRTHVSYQQVHRGVPVFGAVLRAHVDADGDLTAVNGAAVPDLDVATEPGLTPAEAAERAVAHVAADPPADHDDGEASTTPLDRATLTAESTTLYVYRTGLIRRVPGSDLLVYEVVVSNGRDVREVVHVHAHSGKVVNRYSKVHSALYRRVYERSTATQVWQEGDPFPGLLTTDQQNIVAFSGDSYRLFAHAFGRDSYDGAGAELRGISNDPRITCPNANWNGSTTNYCNGTTSDDIVAHEWAHAYTRHTHDLVYQWQSGALNESYSDIWGEVVDALNGAGTDAPAPRRSVGTCSSRSDLNPVLIINAPASIAGRCAAGGAAFGPRLDSTGITGRVVLADDAAGVSPSDGCEPLVPGAPSGRVVLVDRGSCTFVSKVRNAQNAGAVAVVVANSLDGPPTRMGGADPAIAIPSLMVSRSHGNLIKGELVNGVDVTLRTTAPVEDSYRWLMGEDATAFGGAIRDLWNPTCLGDPGKVTDAEYHCAPSDGGGVHTNSGVPNHGFALLVDGGTFNGRTIAPLGLTKAAHLYWRAQSVYQTPISDFDDHADALEASCTDLIGVDLPGLGTGQTAPGPSGQAVTSADCAAVTAMVAAVELRTDPATQCAFQPLLAQGAPALCAGTKNPPVVFTEDFEDGLAGWTVRNAGVFPGWPGLDWAPATGLPRGRPGSAAFAVDPRTGDCGGGADDVSGVMHLDSPAIRLPDAAILSPRLTFEHYVATEAGWDGGNLRVSVNGGPFELVPATAFSFNRYNATLEPPSDGNTNPLAGEPAFSGTDTGSLRGSWGTSQVDLSAVGVAPGDTLQLRFSFGMDGCTGIDGWYVDDVQVRVCNEKKARKEI